ncbi:MAG: GntR family transcriptional regulator [Ancrocorticia sp.]|uniref:GntR family transcriptional regulator n=1 Tax=Ancrocorticia sp. TaxID=2593684 RepID=UPI003F8E277D
MADPSSKTENPFAPQLVLDRDSGTPLYQQIANPLEEAITTGKVEPGRLIEDEVSMAARLSVSRPTARRALQDLVSRGLLTRRRGVGTRVTPSQVRRPLSLTSLNDDLTKSGFEPHTEVMSYEVKLASEKEAELLGCPTGTEIIQVRRRRFIDERALAIMLNLLPAVSAPTLTELSTSGLYASLAKRGVQPATAQQSVGARIATEEDATILETEPGAALLTMQRTAYDAAGAVVEYGSHIYNADLYSFHFALGAE